MTSDHQSAAHPTRRTVVRAVPAVGAGGVGGAALAGCGDGDAATKDDSKATQVAAAQVPVGGGYVDKQAKVVVTQPKAGEFKAFSGVCTHAGCVVGSVEEGQIICPCHNSRFDMTSGEPLSGPAEKALPAKKATEQGGQIKVS